MTDGPAGSCQNLRDSFFCSHSWLLNSLVKRRPAAAVCGCWGGGRKGAAPASPTADMKEFAPIWPCASCCVLSGIVSEAGAAPRLCNINKRTHAKITNTAKAWKRFRTGKNIFAVLLPACFPPLSPLFLSFCLSPAVTRSNPESNDHRSLTLIKGGQLTGGPGVTFIRRLVKVYFSLALNKWWWWGGDRQTACRRRGGDLKKSKRNLWRVVCCVCYLFC